MKMLSSLCDVFEWQSKRESPETRVTITKDDCDTCLTADDIVLCAISFKNHEICVFHTQDKSEVTAVDNYNFDNEEKETPQINTTKRITENRYISNNISNNNYSPPPIISKNNENENDKNKKNKNTFKERFQRIMENKENTDNLENLENIENNTNNNNNDTPSFSKYRQFNKINININTDIKGNNNMQEKKNLLFKLLL